jgi:hypothetical protein
MERNYNNDNSILILKRLIFYLLFENYLLYEKHNLMYIHLSIWLVLISSFS